MDATPSTRSHHREHVLFASLALILLFAQWRAISAPIWSVRDLLTVTALTAVFWLGWTLVLVSTLLIDHFELFRLKQVFARLGSRKLPAPTVQTHSLTAVSGIRSTSPSCSRSGPRRP